MSAKGKGRKGFSERTVQWGLGFYHKHPAVALAVVALSVAAVSATIFVLMGFSTIKEPVQFIYSNF